MLGTAPLALFVRCDSARRWRHCRVPCARRCWRRPARVPVVGMCRPGSGSYACLSGDRPGEGLPALPDFRLEHPLIRPPPLSPSKRPRPFTTFQSLLCFTPGGVEVKVIDRAPPGQRNDLITDLSGGSTGPSMKFPPAQKAESPLVDPERTSPVDSPLALRGAKCVLIRIGSPPCLALAPGSSPPAVVPASSAPVVDRLSSSSSSAHAAMPSRETISSTVKGS
jgi:hypothetical protein